MLSISETLEKFARELAKCSCGSRPEMMYNHKTDLYGVVCPHCYACLGCSHRRPESAVESWNMGERSLSF